MKHPEEYYRLYFGSQADYYLEVLKKINSGKIVAFNFAAFMFGFFWLLYRKMYKATLFLLLIIISEAILEEMILDSFNATSSMRIGIERLVLLIIASLTGLFANYFYMIQADRKISNILKLNLPQEKTKQKIEQKGAVTLLPHLIIAFLCAGLYILTEEGFL